MQFLSGYRAALNDLRRLADLREVMSLKLAILLDDMHVDADDMERGACGDCAQAKEAGAAGVRARTGGRAMTARIIECSPRRIQRKSTKGWRMPKGAIYVGRPTKWGNRFRPGQYWAAGYSGSLETAIGHCVAAYRAWLERRKHWAHGACLTEPPDISALRGHDLACWCPLDQPCHADVLLDLANR